MTVSARGAVTPDAQCTQARHAGVAWTAAPHTLAHSQWPRTRMLAAMCGETMAETIHMLVSDPNPLVRAYATAHEHATREQVNKAMSDTDAQVVTRAARKRGNPQLLAKAATREDREARMVAAGDPHTPQDAPHALVRDADMRARIRAARSHALTPDMRMILAEDEGAVGAHRERRRNKRPAYSRHRRTRQRRGRGTRRRPKRAHRPQRPHAPVNARGRAGAPTHSIARGRA